MIIYFSGTGNSRYCAEVMAAHLNDELLDSFHFIRDHIAAELISGTPWVFVSPTYAWQIPHVFRDFIRSGNFEGSRDAYFVMTCGSDIGNAEESLKELCEEKNLTYRGVLEVVMPENYITLFRAPSPEKAEKMLDLAVPKLKKAVRRIEKLEEFPTSGSGALNGMKSNLVNRVFYRMFVNDKKYFVKDSCVGCGKCETVCPLANIRMVEGWPQWGGNCTQCMACINGCPTEAIEYGSRSKGKRRYLCTREIKR